MLDQGALAAEVAREHPSDLAEADVRLVDEQQGVFGEEVHQGIRRLARLAAREVPAVVLDPRAIADLQEHLDVVPRPRREPLGFEELALLLELLEPLLQLGLDRLDGALDPLLGQDEVLGGIDLHLLLLLDDRARGRVDDGEGLDLVAEQLDPEADLLVGRPELDDVPPDAELAAGEVDVVAVVLDVDEPQEHLVAVDDLAELERDHHLAVVVGRAQAVDARDAGDDDHVVPAHQGAGAGQAEPLDLLVDRGVLLDVDVALGDVGFGLVVVVIADEVADGVVGEELLELAVELGRERLVVRHHQRRLAHPGDDVGHRERLARAGDAEQGLVRLLVVQPLDQLLDRLGLVAGRLVRGHQLEVGHGRLIEGKPGSARTGGTAGERRPWPGQSP